MCIRDRRIYAKTASLFETSVATAALISPVDTHTVEKLRQYGHEIGLAFQIVDDILDFTGEQATIGKPVGSDLHQGLITLPAIYYIEQHRQDPLVQNILQGNCPTDQDKVSQLINEIRASDSILLAMEQARQHVNRGLDALRHAPISPERTSLEDLANYITQRDL
jgi:geranylgeranyl pyrophosphate synthase